MSNHTPGPWRIGDACHTIFPPKSDTHSLRAIASINGYRGSDEFRANARLIAAAPELLEACQTIAEQAKRTAITDGSYTIPYATYGALLRVIHKATGE